MKLYKGKHFVVTIDRSTMERGYVLLTRGEDGEHHAENPPLKRRVFETCFGFSPDWPYNNVKTTTIEEAIEKNLTISFVEPDTDGVTPVVVTRTCAEVIELGKQYHAWMAKERPEIAARITAEFPDGYPDRELVLDYLAVNWAEIEPPTV